MNVAEARAANEDRVGGEKNGRFREAVYAVIGAAVIIGVLFAPGPVGDQLFPLIVLVGPLLTGIVMRLGGRRWQLGAAAWALSGVFMLVFDWIVNNEDQAFHVVLTLMMAALVALGALIGRAIVSARLRFARSKS